MADWRVDKEAASTRSSFFSDVKNFLIAWNNSFPLDLWFRQKYNIPFNSSKHREVNFIDVLLEYEEEKLIKEYGKAEEQNKDYRDKFQVTGRFYYPNVGPRKRITQKDAEAFGMDQIRQMAEQVKKQKEREATLKKKEEDNGK